MHQRVKECSGNRRRCEGTEQARRSTTRHRTASAATFGAQRTSTTVCSFAIVISDTRCTPSFLNKRRSLIHRSRQESAADCISDGDWPSSVTALLPARLAGRSRFTIAHAE